MATADWVQIRHCSRCGAWWDMQPANRPAVITRDEAARRVPDADGWTVVGPLLEPRAPGALLVDTQRVDAHSGDQVDLHRQVELAGDATLRDVVVTVVEPFVWSAPRTTWLVRGRSEGGAWLPLAEVVTAGPPERHGTRMLLADSSAREFAGGSRLEISCLTPR
ncbi:hypothetical protein NMQ01_06150 [Janibacter sp. CX7]|uniref:hypothetical protein n=1 Tax=Janibacter sp. CX7 TaxID=2963431 RepID=UPI0020CF7B1E|nr:hypothetical protein [Janibacter sp. CX7]UTT67291.1 hypothetical protein NMQ01_06150 [Janibacter sp. CX7]